MKCFIFSNDLMFSSQVTGAAKSAGCDCTTVSNVAQCHAETPFIVVLDLSVPGLDIASTVSDLRTGQAIIVAIAPHVHEAKLDAARASGCAEVLTKGQASRELGEVLQRLAEQASTD